MPVDERKDWQHEMSGWRDLFDSCILAVTRKANLKDWQHEMSGRLCFRYALAFLIGVLAAVVLETFGTSYLWTLNDSSRSSGL